MRLALADSAAFQAVAEALEASTDLDRLEARGTLRIALKGAGFDAKDVRAHELGVVIERVLPAELGSRGIADPEAAAARLMKALPSGGDENVAESPESVFKRLSDDT